jgi:DNA repair protein RecN (Recombination protein N)
MLRSLRIRNLVIIEDLTVEFAPGLNLLTGETGTGKSIVVDAVALAIGRRADRSLIRAGADKAVVEALFEIESGSAAESWATEQEMLDLFEDRHLVVRREVSATGGAIRLNGSPCTRAMLADLGSRLLELHGQHDFRGLLLPERHLALLDRYGGHDEQARKVRERHQGVLDARRRLEELRLAAENREEQARALQAVVREIESVGPEPGELARLDRERVILRNAEAISALVEEIVERTYEGEITAASLASAAARSASRLAELDPSMSEIVQRLETAAVEIQEAGSAVRDYRDRNDFNPDRLEMVETRRATIERLVLRHGADEAELLARRDEAREQLDGLQGLERELEEASEASGAAERAYTGSARELGARRRETARDLAPGVERQLGALAFGKARVDVCFSESAGDTISCDGGEPVSLHPRGAERAEFMLAANPGEPARPLSKAASGGELSRIMLALHAVIDGAAEDRVLVFDEVDAGVGGRTADAVGARLARLARSHQVLCVTHLPQVAAYADRHFAVRKWVREGRTRTRVEALDGKQRIEELARMLGGKQATSTSRRHASELLAAAANRSRTKSSLKRPIASPTDPPIRSGMRRKP